MHPPLVEAALSMVSRREEVWVVAPELPVSSRIPDVVLARLEPQVLERRFAHGLTRPMGIAEIRIAGVLDRRTGRTADEIAARLGITSRYARRIIGAMVEEGYLLNRSTGFMLSRAQAPIVSRVVSFEAKISDWRGGLIQARAHLGFANASYLVFDRHYRARFERARPHFKAARVGLVGLSADGDHERLLASRGPGLNRFERAAVSEAIFGRLVGAPTEPLPETRLPSVSAPSDDPRGAMIAGRHSKRLARLPTVAVFA